MLREENLRLKISLAFMIQQFYNWKLSPEEANAYKIKYDLEDESITCYFHQYEAAGERAWDVLGFKNPIISTEELDTLVEDLRNELLQIQYNYKFKTAREQNKEEE